MTRTSKRGWATVVSALVAGACFLVLWPSLSVGNAHPGAVSTVVIHPEQTVVAARGRLQPAGGVLRVAGPNRPGTVIRTLSVREGDVVAAGQVLAVLEGTDVQQASVRRLAAAARYAATELQRIQQLFRQGVVSAAERDTAEMQAAVARADLARAEAALDASSVRAPAAGQVLTIHTHAGERIGADGVLDLGNTAQMEVVAEVYETDIGNVRVGQKATVTAAALPEPITGTVERVGLTIGKQSVFDINPAADTDARVVEVHIRLHADERAASLTNLQVDVDFGV